jgi:thioredoxin-related protein
MVHQPFSFNLIVEVEKDAAESIFHFIKEKFKNVYLNPNAETYKNYIAGNTDSIIVKSMITESPLQEIYSVHAPSIEKILVDIYCDTNIYSAFQGKEMQNIYRNAVNNYTVNLSTLARYALRRGKKEEIGNYLSHLGIKVRNKTT